MLNRRLRIFGLASLIAFPALCLDAEMNEAKAQRQSVGEMRRIMQQRAEKNREFHRRNQPLYQSWREQSARQDAERRKQGPTRRQTGVSR